MRYEKLNIGFTLIEMSVVLVIIGLLAGGVLTGIDLVNAASERAQVSQITQFNTATRTFQNKYGYLPGDIPAPYATQFGFISRGPNPGQGDGNGLLLAYSGNMTGTGQTGENIVFWNDLSSASLISGKYIGVVALGQKITVNSASYPLREYLPQAMIGSNNFIYTISMAGNNYFSLSNYSGNSNIQTDGGNATNTSALTVRQAYDIDSKIDDGFPQTGHVQAILAGWAWAGDFYNYYGGNGIPGTNTSGWSGTAASCFDNKGQGGATEIYTIRISGGSNINCALTFAMQ